MSATTPDSYTEVKFYLKFSNVEDFTDISGSGEDYAVTKTGKIPLIKRNKDFTLQIMTFSFNLYSTTEVLRGMRFKAERNDTVIFRGFVDDVAFDVDKNEYTVKIAHEFKLLQRYNIRKTDLEPTSFRDSDSISRMCKYLIEETLGVIIDFSEAETYDLGLAIPGITLLSAVYIRKVFWCVGLDYATSEPDEESTSTYWEVFTTSMGILGCIVYFDGTQYVVKHLTQDSNYDIDNLDFLDKNKDSYIATKEFYNSSGFVANYNSNLTTYDEVPVPPDPENPDDIDFSLTEHRLYSAITKNLDVSLIDNLYPVLTVSTTNRIDLLNIGRVEFQKYYIDDYTRQPATTDYDMTNNLVLSKEYDVINDNMQIEQHIPYDFQVANYYYYNEFGFKTTIVSGSELTQNDSVYVEFNKQVDEDSLNLIDIRLDGVKVNTTNTFQSSTSTVNSNTIRLAFLSLAVDGYTIRINSEFKSVTQRRIPQSFLIIEKGFAVVEGAPPE